MRAHVPSLRESEISRLTSSLHSAKQIFDLLDALRARREVISHDVTPKVSQRPLDAQFALGFRISFLEVIFIKLLVLIPIPYIIIWHNSEDLAEDVGILSRS